jgi:hypothetical protein
MDEADRVFGGPAALTDALRTLHGTLARLAPGHGGVALSFNDVGDPIVGPTIGRGPFLPGTHQEGEGRVYQGWLTSASAHARLHCAAGFDAARALWAIVDAFHPDLHPTDVPAFAVVGPVSDPRLVVTSGPLRTGPSNGTWSIVDTRLPLEDQVAVLWHAALHALHSDQRFLTGHNATTLRAANATDLHHVLHATGHATAWVVQEPLRLDGVARRLDKGTIGWSDTPRNDRVRAVESSLAALLEHLTNHTLDSTGFAVWHDGTSIRQSFQHKDKAKHALPKPLGGMAKRTIQRLADAVPLFGSDGVAWGAPARVVWTQKASVYGWSSASQTAGMVFETGTPWLGGATSARIRELDPWVAEPSTDPWWVAYHHQDGKRGQPRMFQAADVEAATERCIVACRQTIDQRNGWMPFHQRQLLLWPVARPSLPPTTPLQGPTA